MRFHNTGGGQRKLSLRLDGFPSANLVLPRGDEIDWTTVLSPGAVRALAGVGESTRSLEVWSDGDGWALSAFDIRNYHARAGEPPLAVVVPERAAIERPASGVLPVGIAFAVLALLTVLWPRSEFLAVRLVGHGLAVTSSLVMAICLDPAASLLLQIAVVATGVCARGRRALRSSPPVGVTAARVVDAIEHPSRLDGRHSLLDAPSADVRTGCGVSGARRDRDRPADLRRGGQQPGVLRSAQHAAHDGRGGGSRRVLRSAADAPRDRASDPGDQRVGGRGLCRPGDRASVNRCPHAVAETERSDRVAVGRHGQCADWHCGVGRVRTRRHRTSVFHGAGAGGARRACDVSVQSGGGVTHCCRRSQRPRCRPLPARRQSCSPYSTSCR